MAKLWFSVGFLCLLVVDIAVAIWFLIGCPGV